MTVNVSFPKETFLLQKDFGAFKEHSLGYPPDHGRATCMGSSVNPPFLSK